jgi:hypothetical protein
MTKCKQYIEKYNEGKLNMIDNENLKFKDQEKKEKNQSVFHKRCIKIVESS